MKIKVSDYIAKFFEAQKLRHIFMVAGGGCIHMVDSFGRNENIMEIPMMHEQGASIAAEAYAQYTNMPSALLVTTGPGGTNAITGVTSAWLDSVPMVILSGQVQRKDMKQDGQRQNGFQEVDIVSMVRGVTKYAKTIITPEEIPIQLAKAYELANMGRKGPVWLDIPLDVQSAEIEVDNVQMEFYKKQKAWEECVANDAATWITTVLPQAQRPMVLIGNGARGCADKAISLCHALSVPYMLTWKAADFAPDDDPLFVGRPGAIAQRGANIAQQQADLVICLGARLDHGQVAYRSDLFAEQAQKIVIDIDRGEAEKHMEWGVEDRYYVTDAANVIKNLAYMTLANLDIMNPDRRATWIEHCQQLKAGNPVITDRHRETLNPYSFVDKLSDIMEEGDILVPSSSGTAAEVIMQAFRVKPGQRIINSQGLGAMGFAIPAAIGVAFASGKRVICVDGDGSFMMNMQELAVASMYDLPITFFIWDNDGYVSIRNTQDKLFNERYFGSENLWKLNWRYSASSFNMPYNEISDEYSLQAVWKYYFEEEREERPRLIVAAMPSTHETVPRTKSYMNDDGEMETAPMDDLYMGSE